MALSNIEKHYNKHPEGLRLQRRHGIVESETTMHHLRRYIKPDSFLLDIGAGTGCYTSAFMAEGYRVKAVEQLLGLLYHLIGDEEKLKALKEAKRVTKTGGLIFVAYLMNEYSILSYCFDEDRIEGLMERGAVDGDFHIQAQAYELYDYMRTRLNRMSDETFARFIEYQKCISERADLIGAGSHVVDVVRA